MPHRTFQTPHPRRLHAWLAWACLTLSSLAATLPAADAHAPARSPAHSPARIAAQAALRAAKDADIRLDANHTLLAPVRYKNLTVWQIRAHQVEKLDNLVALPQAQAARQVEIRELEAGGQVNSLVIENKGQATVMVLAGTIVKGGKQDRQIGQDFVVAPGQTVNVDSFCVEHGRWTTQRQAQSRNSGSVNLGGYGAVGVMGVGGGGGVAYGGQVRSALRTAPLADAADASVRSPADIVTNDRLDITPGTDAPPEVARASATVYYRNPDAAPPPTAQAAPVADAVAPAERIDTAGQFEAQASLANSTVRAKGQYEANQQEVWDEVARTNRAAGAAPATGTLMATKERAAVDPDRQAMVTLLKQKLQPPAGAQVVGLAYAVNGEIVNLRWFLAPALYAGFRDALIETIADDTLARSAELGAAKIAAYAHAPTPCGAAEFRRFMLAAREEKQKRDAGANCNTYYESPAAYSSETVGKTGALEGKILSSDYTAR